MTPEEQALLDFIGTHVAGPRHMMSLEATNENLELVENLIGQGLAESTRYVHQAVYPFIHVCLTGRGWVRYKEGLG